MADDLLAQVREGMEVFDADGRQVGTVQDLYLGAVGGSSRSTEPATAGDGGEALDDLGDVLGAVDSREGDMPETVRNRLRREGYVRIDPGLLGGSRYALRGQVQAVRGDRVELNARMADLIKV
jgi:hypothetical protein